MPTKPLTAAEIDKLPLSEADRLRLKAHYGYVEDLGGDDRPTTAATKAFDAAKAVQVEDLGGDTGPVTAAQKQADAQKAASMGYAPGAVKILQPKPVYVPMAPASSSIGKIAMVQPVLERPDGPALDVDSAGIGKALLPSYVSKPFTVGDYGSADMPYEVGELGGLGMVEPDKIVMKKPKETVFDSDPLVVQAAPSKKYAAAKGK